jgi:HPt (histidine-containing phosphotransfer) domain-containing protein
MMQENTTELTQNNYLCVADAIQKVCDAELVYEMLNMLDVSIGSDWATFEKYVGNNQYELAANILHGMKGTVPIFSDKKTEAVMQKTESLLRNHVGGVELENTVKELSFQMIGFMAELKLWVKWQDQLPFNAVAHSIS